MKLNKGSIGIRLFAHNNPVTFNLYLSEDFYAAKAADGGYYEIQFKCKKQIFLYEQ
jgi:hypothetical protein